MSDSDVILLSDTDATAIGNTLLDLRQHSGATGLVFTMVVVCSSRTYREALAAAIDAARDNPSRILVAVRSKSKNTRLDAEVRRRADVPGAIITLRMSGEVNDHPDSVILPLLLPDLPAVIWWPGASPRDPANDTIGRLGTRRITDCTGAHHPIQALVDRGYTHRSGHTDLTWTRLTRWRALLVAALDQVCAPVTAAQVDAPAGTGPGELMASWLQARLNLSVERRFTTGPGTIQGVHLKTPEGTISLVRISLKEALLSLPGQPDRAVALEIRNTNDLLSEELRRLDPDPVFSEAMCFLLGRQRRD